MSYPRLILSGAVDERAITGIAVSYDNDTLTDKPAHLTRVRYDVKREYRNRSSSGGTKLLNPVVVYDTFRLEHRWVGYIDVLTESVAITAASTDADKLTVNLIKLAAILKIDTGVEYTIKSFESADLGPEESSLGGTYTKAFEQGFGWKYQVSSDGGNPPAYTYGTTNWWVIKDINIVDNGNNTSRVTFSLEIKEAWEDLVKIIDDLKAE